MKIQKIGVKLLTLLLTAVMLCSWSVPASAAFTFFTNEEIVEEEGDHSCNTSYVSSYVILIGESFILTGNSDELDPAKCTYAFYVRYNRQKWKTIHGFSKLSEVEYTPDKTGSYEFCIKIKCQKKIYKRYYTCTVTRPIINHSLVSTSYLQRGDALEMNALASGGEGGFQFAYLMKRTEDTEWTTLSDYAATPTLQWTPRDSGEYELCIKAMDNLGTEKEKTFPLTVSSDGRQYPAEFTLTVKSPIASPYLWDCQISDESILKCELESKTYNDDMLDPCVLLKYRVTPLSAGAVDLTMSYLDCNGKSSELHYHLVVDKTLNYRVTGQEGSYFEEELPQPQQIRKTFRLNLKRPDENHTWICELGNSQIIEYRRSISALTEDVYLLQTIRRGYTTLTFSCTSTKDASVKYKLIYTIAVDDDRNASVLTADGYYLSDEELPMPYSS